MSVDLAADLSWPNLWSDTRAQGLLEYALILGLVAMVAIGALLMVGNGVANAIGAPSDITGS